MTAPTPVGFLDFFILEASDYVEQLDALLLSGGDAGPDADTLQRVARALRGSATMAKLTSFSEMAAGVERVGRALREGALSWNPGLRGAVVATVDDCKLLLRNVRAWSDADEARARARIAELTSYAAVRGPTPMASPTLQGHDSYLATEASNIGAGLELLATRPNDRDAATNVLRRVRALRGIASVKDHASLADVLEAAEQAIHPLEIGEPALSGDRAALLGAAATVLRSIAASIRTGVTTDAQAADVAKFAATLDALQSRETTFERVVPISELFYDDGGVTVIEASSSPPTTTAERFRLEVVSQGEHLRRLISDARGANDELARERVRRALRLALRGLHQAAESFGENDVAEFITSHREAADRLDARALRSLDEVATLLAQPGAAPAPIGERISALKTSRASASMMTPAIAQLAIAEPTLEPQERVRPAAQQVAEEVAREKPAANQIDLLAAGIDKLTSLGGTPLSAPVAIPEQPTVAIDVLLYRGRSAILRAVEIRDEARQDGKTVEGEALDELLDLLDLALTN
ncbi:MAG: Hpt domain-containing protein [bacterium]